MNAKMTIEDAAKYLGRSPSWVYTELQDKGLQVESLDNHCYFKHPTALELFQIKLKPKVFVFQILKGGTGKTSLAYEFAIRANLYGARVVCLDLDQQGNLTASFNQNAQESPVMIDLLTEDYDILDALLSVEAGLDLLPSRIENALLDEAIRAKKCPLEQIYRNLFEQLKSSYDVIIVDCPPTLSQSVAAAALGADRLIAPVIPEKFALLGLKATCQTIVELESAYSYELPYSIVLNKFEPHSIRSQQTLEWLMHHEEYGDKLLNTKIHLSDDFPEAALKMHSIFDQVEPSTAKSDIDALTRQLLDIRSSTHNNKSKALFQKDYVFA